MAKFLLRSKFQFLCSLILCLFFAVAIAAQSGRRGKPTPAVLPTPEPTPIPGKPVEKLKPLTFIVGVDRYASFQRIHLSAVTGIARTCAQRLDEPQTTKAEMVERDMDRSDAVRRAKEETEDYVVWIKLRPDSMGDNNGDSSDFTEIYLEYTVFAPGTGKQVTTGHAYPNAYRKSTVIMRPRGVNEDAYFNEAARDVADQILNHFHVGQVRP